MFAQPGKGHWAAQAKTALTVHGNDQGPELLEQPQAPPARKGSPAPETVAQGSANGASDRRGSTRRAQHKLTALTTLEPELEARYHVTLATAANSLSAHASCDRAIAATSQTLDMMTTCFTVFSTATSQRSTKMSRYARHAKRCSTERQRPRLQRSTISREQLGSLPSESSDAQPKAVARCSRAEASQRRWMRAASRDGGSPVLRSHSRPRRGLHAMIEPMPGPEERELVVGPEGAPLHVTRAAIPVVGVTRRLSPPPTGTGPSAGASCA